MLRRDLNRMSQIQPKPSSAQDEDIVCLLRAQDPIGLQQLLRKYGGRVRNNLRHELSGVLAVNDLDEVLNRAAYLAWRHAGTYTEERGKLGTWFYIIARNAALSLVRDVRPPHGRKVVESIDLASISAEEATPLGHGAAAAKAHADAKSIGPSERQARFIASFRTCIGELSPRQQVIIKADLRAGERADAGDLATTLKTTKESIYVSRSAARKALRAAMQRHGYFGGDPDATATGIPTDAPIEPDQ